MVFLYKCDECNGKKPKYFCDTSCYDEYHEEFNLEHIKGQYVTSERSLTCRNCHERIRN